MPVFSLFGAFPDPVYVIDPDGTILDANEKVSERFGLELSRCIGANIYERIDSCSFYPAGHGAVRRAQVEQVLRTGRRDSFEVELNGRVFRYDISPVRSPEGTITQLFIISQEITEQKAFEVESAGLLARTNAALQSVAAAVWQINSDGTSVVRSPGHDLLYGYEAPLAQWTQKQFLTHVVEEDRPRVVANIRDMMAGVKRTWVDEFRIRRLDGSIRWLSVGGTTRFDESGLPESWSGIVQDITEKKKAEQRYRDMVQQWEFTMDTCHLGAWTQDGLNGPVQHSMEHDRIFGYDSPLAEWDFRIFLDHVVPEDRDRVSLLFQDIQTKLLKWETEYRIRRRDGEVRWLWDVGAITRDDRGRIIRCMGVTKDITEKRAAAQELMDYRAEMEFVLESSHVGVWKIDLNDMTVAANSELSRIYGYEPTTVGWSYALLLDHILPEERERIDRLFHEAVARQLPLRFECRIRRPDGETRWISVFGMFRCDREGHGSRMLGIIHDITERKQAEDELADSKARLSQALTATRAGVWSWEPDTGTMVYSDELWAMSGFDKRTTSASFGFWVERIHPDDREAAVAGVLQASRDGVEIEQEYRIRLADGSACWLMVRGTPQMDAAGKAVRYIGTAFDITAHKQAEIEREALQQQLQQSQKMELLGRLAGGIAHDFNNILTVIIGHAELLMTSPDTKPSALDNITCIRQAAQRSAAIVQQLLGFAKKQRVEPRLVYPDREIAAMLPMLKPLIRENIRVEWQPETLPSPVLIDPGQLFQIVSNLVLNARDAIAGGGGITISTSTVHVDEEDCIAAHCCKAPGDFVRISVSDTGSGIDPSMLPHIFEPFFTTKEVGKGSGLGLATTLGIVQQNNGYIGCRSSEGGGTTFDVFLPLSRGAAGETVPGVEAEPPDSPSRATILVVEDEPDLLLLIRKVLEPEGYRVISAENAEQAMALAATAEPAIDLLLTDVMLPGMGGVELSRKLMERYPEVGVILMSGYTTEQAGAEGMVFGVANYLPKPFTIGELLRTIELVLAGRDA